MEKRINMLGEIKDVMKKGYATYISWIEKIVQLGRKTMRIPIRCLRFTLTQDLMITSTQ